MMNVLFIGDVVGDAGCKFLNSKIYEIKKEYKVDFTIINGENSAQGNGITPKSLNYLLQTGADVVTTGNHAFRRREMAGVFDQKRDMLIRPANYPKGVEGSGYTEVDLGKIKIAVINLMGTIYMDSLDNPFNAVDDILQKIDTPNIFVDFHAEATSEKKAMGFYLEKRVTAVIGTHTHVQTSDETILGGHTAYITDAGMTGPELSVLGVESNIIITKLKYHIPVKFEESTQPCFINGVVVQFDEKLGKATNIKRIISRK